jgi:hypothetical protein
MIRTPVYAQGTRVRVRRGRYPIDPGVIGRTGLVVETDDYRPQRYGVVLDDETEQREFNEDELEPLATR